NGIGIDRSLATLLSQANLTNSDTWQVLYFPINSVPGADRSKVRGEERFSIYSLEDYQAPASQLASQFIQIWPVADGSISGITSGETIRSAMPNVTLTMHDLYPDSQVFAKIYKGASNLSATGQIVPGSAQIIYEAVPQDRTLTLTDWDTVLDDDGQWTIDLMTTTPFGTDRLASVTFNLDRIIKVNGSVTTAE
ncbi:MAG: hypothetical protein KDM64_09045, partial [Verrucomicrobiae bacterium]|nr:hypothetical protein [Verrucomicrobiae bacterium]